MNETVSLRANMQSTGGTAVRYRYQSRETVLQSLHGELHLSPDDVSVEVHVQAQVQVFGDAPGEGGEGARVRHDDLSGNNGETESTVTQAAGLLPEQTPLTSVTSLFKIKDAVEFMLFFEVM